MTQHSTASHGPIDLTVRRLLDAPVARSHVLPLRRPAADSQRAPHPRGRTATPAARSAPWFDTGFPALPLAVLTAWTLVLYPLAARIFRWV